MPQSSSMWIKRRFLYVLVFCCCTSSVHWEKSACYHIATPVSNSYMQYIEAAVSARCLMLKAESNAGHVISNIRDTHKYKSTTHTSNLSDEMQTFGLQQEAGTLADT